MSSQPYFLNSLPPNSLNVHHQVDTIKIIVELFQFFTSVYNTNVVFDAYSWYYITTETLLHTGETYMFNVQMVGDKLIPNLPHNFNVDADNKEDMEKKISDVAGVDISILFIDVLDMNGRDHDTVISVDGSYHSHRANVTQTTVI
ncbi:MAG: hypothetical protein CL840_03445 [Crocinitomicaceae bacterium]|nr:hypothetical protein [Crocinitomicaceae bacterium]